MDVFETCRQIYEAVRYFTYGIPVDGVIKNVPTAEYFDENYRFLSPQEFVELEGGVCWDYVEYERTCCENHGLKYHQYYIITDTPPNYDTHTFITVEDGDELIYIESSFKKVEHIIDGVKRFKSLEEIVNLITTTMFSCNGNDKRFDEIKYDVMEYHGHPAYGCTCQEYMKWMNENAEMVIQDTAVNPKNISTDELTVEEMTIPEYHTHEDDEEYNEAIHDHIKDEDDIYNESWTDFKNGVHPSSGLMFHVSLKNDMDGKTINPQLPSYITDGGKLDDNYQEDTKTKRLCVSPSIEGCLIAILNYNKIREHVGDKFYVYTPEKPFSQYKHKTNKEIVKDKLVFDANITKEAWILEPCKLKLYGIIKLKKVKDLKKKPTVEKNIKMNTIKLDYEWIMTPKASGKFNKAIGDSPDKEDTKEKPINEYAVPGSFYHDIKPHPGGVYALVEDDSYRSHFCHIDFQGHDNKYLGWNAPTGSELLLKTQEVIKSEKWEFRKSETDTVIPEYTHIFTYAQQILPIIRLDKIKDRLRDLLAPYCPLTVHDPNSDTDIEYVCIQPQRFDIIDKEKTSYVYDTAYNEMFENHIVYLPIVDNLGMFEVKHTTHVAGTYDDNLFFEELFYGPTISYKLFDAFKDLNSVTLYDISNINAWDFACNYEDHYDEDGERIEPGDPKHPSNKRVNESTNVLMSNEEFFGLSMIQESHKNITKHSFKSLTKKGITVDHDSETGKLVKKVIDNVLKYHSLPSIKLNPSGFGVAKETDTFFYGYPRYIDGEIPTSKGKQLRFMAQINCKELKSLPDYPHTGLLQFWVHGDSEILNDAVKVIYIEKPNKNNIANVSLDEALYSYDDPGDFPRIDIKGYNHSDNLLFKSTTKETIGPNITDLEVLYKIFSEEYKKLTGEKADMSALDDYIWDDDRLQPSWGNRVGGYPSSTQETSSKRTKSWNTMLLQLESIDREVYWGDFGIAAFYISHDDLIKRDFSKVGFDWDCY